MDKSKRLPPTSAPLQRVSLQLRRLMLRVSRGPGLRTLLLLVGVLLVGMLLMALTLFHSPSYSSEHVVSGLEANLRRPVVLDGRSIAYPLPSKYPNGEANRFECDLPSLRFDCDMDTVDGCRAYPQLFPAAELFRNWSPEDAAHEPAQIFSSICRFDVSSPYEFRLAQLFHRMEVPFIAYGIPDLTAASERWTDEYLTTKFTPTQKFKVHVANNSHFMYTKRSDALSGEEPTYESMWWTYPEFVEAVAATKQVPPGEPHDYYYFMLKQGDIASRSSFVYDELSFMDVRLPQGATPYGDFFIRDARAALDKGMRCRLGMQGIVAEGHVDGGLNMIAMVRGRKRYVLSPPSVCGCLHLLSEGQSRRHTSLNWSDVDSLPANAKACPATEVIINQGEVLYVPSYWYHHIVSLDESIQCNVRSGVAIRDETRKYLHECGVADL